MGLDSPRSSVKKKPTPGADDHREGGAKSIMDDLLGGGSVNKHLERPGTGERRELPFEKKLASAGWLIRLMIIEEIMLYFQYDV